MMSIRNKEAEAEGKKSVEVSKMRQLGGSGGGREATGRVSVVESMEGEGERLQQGDNDDAKGEGLLRH